MQGAAWVERGAAARAGAGRGQILVDGEARAANAAQNGLRRALGNRPHGDGVVGDGAMAVDARIPPAAALELQGHDIPRRVVVGAARLRVDAEAEDANTMHRERLGAVCATPSVPGLGRSGGRTAALLTIARTKVCHPVLTSFNATVAHWPASKRSTQAAAPLPGKSSA